VRTASRQATFAPKQERGRMRHSRICRALFATAAVLASSGAAMAQTQTAAATTSGIETVIVTAQYKTQNIQSTPLAISAVTAQDLDQRGINDISQLASTVPALTLNKTPAAFGSGVQTYIRGVGQYDTAFAAEPGVGMYIDDVYYGTMFGSDFDLLDLSRVEVLKGPQGVLGGKNNIGGSIKMVSQKPTDDNSGYLDATYGSFNEINVKGAFNATIMPDHLFLRVSAISRHQDGYVDVIDYACAHPATAGNLPSFTQHPGCQIGTEGGTDVSAARLALRALFPYHIEDNFAADVIRDNSEMQADTLFAADTGDGFVYYNNDGNGVKKLDRNKFFTPNSLGVVGFQSGIPAWNNAQQVCFAPGLCFGPGPIALFGIPWDQRFIPANTLKTSYATLQDQAGHVYADGARVHAWGISNVMDWDILDNLHFKMITGYRYYNAANTNDNDVSPMSYELTTSLPTNREFQQEERFTGTLLDDKLDWTAGFFYYDRTNTQHGPVTLDANYDTGATFLVFEQNDRYITTNKSGYVHAIYHLWDNLEFFGGIRYTSERKTYYFDHSGVVPGYPLGGFFRSTVDPLLDCNIFAGHFCDHSIHPALLPHTSRSERPDYRAGLDYHVTDDVMTYFQFSTGYRTGGTNSRPFAPDQLDSYGPEQIKSYELGAKSDWFDHRLRVNAAVYMANYTDIITPLAQTDYSLGFPLPYVHYVNLGSAKDKGFELEGTAVPIDNLVIDASVSYTHLRATPLPGAISCPQDGPLVCGPGVSGQFLDGCSPSAAAAGICPQVAVGTVREGSQPILFPETTAHIGAQYTFHLGGNAGMLTPRLDWAYQGTIYQDGNNNPYTAIKSRGLLDGRLTWDAPAGGWSVSLAGTNLTDEKYFLNVFNLAIFGSGTIEGQPGLPREWTITVKKAF
jgi:iron complex outermembrane receptor protein